MTVYMIVTRDKYRLPRKYETIAWGSLTRRWGKEYVQL